MSRTYTEEERAEALAVLRSSYNSIPITSRKTGIPERTLRDWRRQADVELWLPPSPPSAAAVEKKLADFENRAAAIQFIQDRILQELLAKVDMLDEIMATASPYHQMLMIIQFVDRIDKLQSLVASNETEHTYRVEFVDPRNGSVSLKPYWEQSDDDE